MKPQKKKKRQFRQSFARFLQLVTPKKNGNAPFTGPLDSIAILAQEKLGDCILLTPLVRQLRQAFPESEIHIIAFSQASASFFRNDPAVTAVHLAKKRPRSYFSEVLSRKFDLLFNTKDHPSTHFLLQSALLRARFRTGIANPFHEGLYDRLLDIGWHTHIVTKNCALLDLLGVAHTAESCRPSIPAMPVQPSLQAFCGNLPEKVMAGINISAGGPLRYWSEEKWKELVLRLPEIRFIVFAAPDDLEMKQRIETLSNVLPSPSTQNLYEVSLLVKKLRLLVTPDTSLIHIASCFAVPVVGLYREAPQDLSRFAPYLTEHRLIASTTTQVRDIPVDEVFGAVRSLPGNQAD